jgi:hypothetical protein
MANVSWREVRVATAALNKRRVHGAKVFLRAKSCSKDALRACTDLVCSVLVFDTPGETIARLLPSSFR